MSTKLEQLKAMTTVVADTGDIEAIRSWKPVDATTNPSLLLKAAAMPQYAELLTQSVQQAADTQDDLDSKIQAAADLLAVKIGKEILEVIPGRISTEVDARLSLDTDATIAKARNLIALYEGMGVPRERVLIKIASTWEGIKAAEQLEKENIQCNLTLLFSFAQAVAAAEAGVFLISPFVGRILDWYKANSDTQEYAPSEDPGVISVTKIYNYYKQHGYQTVVMGASFRNIGEIEELAGCDRLTISPDLLAELDASSEPLEQKLKADDSITEPPAALNEAQFRWQHNQDAMATEKLADGIRRFAIDQEKLESLLREQF